MSSTYPPPLVRRTRSGRAPCAAPTRTSGGSCARSPEAVRPTRRRPADRRDTTRPASRSRRARTARWRRPPSGTRPPSCVHLQRSEDGELHHGSLGRNRTALLPISTGLQPRRATVLRSQIALPPTSLHPKENPMTQSTVELLAARRRRPRLHRRHHRGADPRSTSGSATAGACSSRTRRTSRPSAPPSSARSLASSPSSNARNVKVIGLSVDPLDVARAVGARHRRDPGPRAQLPADRRPGPHRLRPLRDDPPERERHHHGAQRVRDRPRQEGQAHDHLPPEHGPQLRRDPAGDRLAPAHRPSQGVDTGELEVRTKT